MAAHTEIELKWELTAHDHQRLAARLEEALGPPRLLAQHNRFFDAPSRALRRLGMTVRVRREAELGRLRLYVTCKRRLDGGAAGAHQHEEWEQDIDAALWPSIEQGDASALPLSPAVAAALGAERLAPLGGFANERREHADGSDLLCLDRTDLVSRIDYELEIETPDPARAAAAWAERLSRWEIPWWDQPRTKFARFLALHGA